ncbi:MAG TPA: class I SAM-dependent methyltransferase [Rhizomicrobium sp.]|nr:class I SAM-dependent methyltransferase [Rhizomicrobium sp.]
MSVVKPLPSGSAGNPVKRLIDRISRDRVDWKYRADTAGVIQMDELDVPSPNAKFAYCYRGTLGWVIRLFLRQLPLADKPFDFVDFGSGKGRALLVASEFPFVSVTGVEFCESLHEVAVKNLARLPARQNQAGRVKSVLGDATEFALPQRDLVTYFYNPFGPPVLDAVAERLIAHRHSGFDVYVIYINPRHRDVFERSGKFETVFVHEKGLIYRVNA